VAPYTKVEESFNIQAVHDLLSYTPFRPLSTQSFDHFSFPGAVPRTFVGASLLATLSKPIIYILGTKHSVFYPQLIVRGVLGLLNAAALLRYKNGLERAFGRDVGRWWTLLIGSGFHVVFYASRTLPNMFAFALSEFSHLLL
jgi:alpha-1,6-mannosyltransferase